jgi:mannose-1-phosphate guanylyltransferase/phosphomannomutase
MQAIIVCGGYGSRMSKSQINTPKVLMKLGDLTLLEHQLIRLREAGASKFLLLLGNGAEEIKTFVVEKKLEVEYVVEEQPLGTGGAVLNAFDKLDDEFFLVYGDILFDTNIKDMLSKLQEKDCDAVFLGRASEHIHDSDVLVTDLEHKIVSLIRKPGIVGFKNRNLANCGIYIFRRSVFQSYLKQLNELVKLDLESDILISCFSNGLNAYVVKSNGYVRDLGTPERYQAGIGDVQNGKVHRRAYPTAVLDRDGVIIRDTGHLSSLKNVEILPGVVDSIRDFNSNGYRVVVITNQPVVARGEATLDFVNQVHALIDIELAKNNAFITEYYICPHHPDKGFIGEIKELKIVCDCRKPNIGLYEKANLEFPMDKKESLAIGDSITDAEAAKKFGLEFFGVGESFEINGLNNFRSLREVVTSQFINGTSR